MTAACDELWAVARNGTAIDAAVLARAVEEAIEAPPSSLDYRTRLLIRDSLTALRAHWGPANFDAWLSRAARGAALQELCDSPVMRGAAADEGFPTLTERVVDAIDTNTVMQLLRELSTHVPQPTRLVIGGSIAMMLAGHLARNTDDIDVVDELPASLRVQPDLLQNLARRYGLRLAHFQSHYLPGEWEGRIRSVGAFGNLSVFAVDPYDIFVGKLFSVREKDRDDLRAVAPKLDRTVLLERVRRSTSALCGEQRLADAARENWFVVFGEKLPA